MKIRIFGDNIRYIAMTAAFFLTACSQQLVEMGPPRFENMQEDMAVLTIEAPWKDVVLTLDEIIEIANKRNLDMLVLEQQVLIQDELTGGSVRKWLPQLIWNQELSGRNKNTGSFSQSLDPAVPPAPPSISSQTHINRYDISLTWNLLDFGISMVRSRQEANKTLILQMGYEKERQKLVLEIVKNYWRAVVSRFAMRENKGYVERVAEMVAALHKNVDKRIISWADAYKIETDILKNAPDLYRAEREYYNVIEEMVQQMGLPPGSSFEIPEEKEFPLYANLLPIEAIEEYAMMYRPELYSGDLQELVKADDVKIAMLSAIPGVAFFSGDFWDTNKFLIYNHWLSAGLRVSWDLFRVPERMADYEIAKLNKDLIVQQRIAFAMGVITQVRIAYLAYYEAIETYMIMKELAAAKIRLAEATARGALRGDTPKSTALSYALDALLTESQLLTSYGEVMFSLERLNNAMGIPRFFVAGEEPKVDEYALAH
jgi:outer membrane protein TolC